MTSATETTTPKYAVANPYGIYVQGTQRVCIHSLPANCDVEIELAQIDHDVWTFGTKCGCKDWYERRAAATYSRQFPTRWDAVLAACEQCGIDFNQAMEQGKLALKPLLGVLEQIKSQRAGMALLYAPPGTLKDHLVSSNPPTPKETEPVVTKTRKKAGTGKRTTDDGTHVVKTEQTATKPKRAKQNKFPGTFDPVPADVEEKAEEYCDALKKKNKAGEHFRAIRDQMIATMRAHKIERVELPDGYYIVMKSEDALEKKKIKEPKSPDDEKIKEPKSPDDEKSGGAGDSGYDGDEE